MKMLIKSQFFLFLILLVSFGNCQGTCPDCENIDCFPRFNPEDCPDHSLYVANVIMGCCPACVHYLELGEQCDIDIDSVITSENLATVEKLPCTNVVIERTPYLSNTKANIPLLKIHQCGPPNSAYQCISGTCSVKDPSEEEKCAKDEDEFAQWQQDEVEANACTKYLWEKECNPSGQYQRVQAKYSEFTTKPHRKFCVDPFGNRIFGDAAFDDAEINCLCSRKIWELENVLHQDEVTLHCESNGNYDPLQCNESRCWCVDPQLGHVRSRAVHKDLAKYLSCFNPNTFGQQYLRRCQSRQTGRKKSSKMLAMHGLSWLQDSDFECDYDGSFAAVNCKSQESR